ncbi:DMT family transporter [Thalassovita sp.]|uniref:DMT family transporter n=1 Tax=Thalassovita sp. TaxID=1979401 RepID=UPI002AAF95D7|nr:DMT family transporter [Thalassovita sp.]
MTLDTTGIFLRIGATFFFTLMVILIKFLAEAVPVGQVVFFRSAVALVPLVLFLMWTKDFPSGLRSKRPMGHVMRCLMGCAAMFASFASLKYLPLAHASILGYLAPMLAVVLARFILGENVSPIRWFAVVLSFLGMLVLVLPKATGATVDQSYMIGLALALVMAVFTAGAKIQIRSLALTENAGAIAFYFALTCALAGLLTAGLGWVQPNPMQWLLLIGSGLTGGIAHIMMTLALQKSEVSKLAPFEYLSLIFAVIADYTLFNVVPGLAFVGATALILAAMWLVTFKDQLPQGAKAS